MCLCPSFNSFNVLQIFFIMVKYIEHDICHPSKPCLNAQFSGVNYIYHVMQLSPNSLGKTKTPRPVNDSGPAFSLLGP